MSVPPNQCEKNRLNTYFISSSCRIGNIKILYYPEAYQFYTDWDKKISRQCTIIAMAIKK